MPYKFTWESPRTIYVKFFGTVSFDDVTSATNHFYHDIRSDAVREVLWDFMDIDDFVINQEQVQETAASDTAASMYLGPMKVAFIIQHPLLAEFAYEYIGVMESMNTPWVNQVFKTVEEARMWMSA